MPHCQIQCNFGGTDDLCRLGKEYLIALTCKLCTLFYTKFWNFWRITSLSIISRCKVIWSQKQSGYFGPPCIWHDCQSTNLRVTTKHKCKKTAVKTRVNSEWHI